MALAEGAQPAIKSNEPHAILTDNNRDLSNTSPMVSLAGYSGTPLIRKLGSKPGMRVWTVDPPQHYRDLLGEEAADLKLTARCSGRIDAVHAFHTVADELAANIVRYRKSVLENGMIWVSWPKKASKVSTDVTEDVVRTIALKNALVDVKVCAVDHTWSALKLVIPLHLRKTPPR